MSLTPTPTKIIRIEDEAKKIKTFYLLNKKVAETARPGNFVLAWVPLRSDNKIKRPTKWEQLDQIPISIASTDPSTGVFGITVKEIGPTTSEMHRYQSGAYLGIIGPLGNSFSCKGSTCILVGGGIGVAPLHYLTNILASKGKKLLGFIGFPTKSEILFAERIGDLCDELVITTDDGTYGKKGLITNPLEKSLVKQKGQLLQNRSDVYVYCCGPEIMMKRVFNICEGYGFRAEFSLERYIHCGIGLCGFCSINGYRVCKDGPIFSNEKLRNIRDFGLSRRKNSGKRESVM